MDKAALRRFLQDRFLSFDPALDTSEGSPVDNEVIEPLMRYLGPSPFDAGTYEYVRERIAHFTGGEVVDEADALADLAVKPLAHILEPLMMEIERLRTQQSLIDPDLLTRESAQALGSNFFTSIVQGTFTLGTVRLFFQTPRSMSVTTSNTLSSARGDTFVPTGRQSISQAEMVLNRSGGYYYWDISVRAVEPGRVEVDKGEMVDILGVDAAVRVSNLQPFRTGQPQETTAQFIDRVATALTERSLVTGRGANARLRELFSTIRAVEVAGYNDLEMGRDRVAYHLSGTRAQAASAQTLTWPLTLTAGVNDTIWLDADDGAGGWLGPRSLVIAGVYSTVRGLADTINIAWLAAGGTGVVASGWGANKLLLHSWSDVPNNTYTHEQSLLHLMTPPTRSAWAALGYTAVQLDTHLQGSGGLLLSSMPGGILRPNTAYGSFEPTVEKEFHLGGATDIYVQPAAVDTGELLLLDAEDSRPAWMGTELQTHPTTAASDHVRDMASLSPTARPGRADFTLPLSATALDLPPSDETIFVREMMFGRVVEPGDVLSLYNGDAAGTYAVAATPQTDPTLSTNDLRTNSILPSAGQSNLTYRISKAFSMKLVSPTRRVKVSTLQGTSLRCTGASPYVNWASTSVSHTDTNQFSRFGVQAGDEVEVIAQTNGRESANEGKYVILSVTGPQLLLDRPLAATETVSFRIVEPIRDTLQKPFLRINKANILDSNGADTGRTIPYALPVLLQSRGVQGARILMSGNNGGLDASTPFALTIPTSGRDFASMGVGVGHAVAIYHATAFGASTSVVYRRVYSVSGHSIMLDEALSLTGGFSTTEARYEIGHPSRGIVRCYFQDPVSFEWQHDWLEWSPNDLSTTLFSSTDRALFSRDSAVVQDDETRYVIESRGVFGGMRLYPNAGIGEIEEGVNLGIDTVPTYAQDVQADWSSVLADPYPTLSFTTFKCREHFLRPHDTTYQKIGDMLLLVPERHIGVGITTTYTSATIAERDHLHRQVFCVGRIENETPGQLDIVPDAFNSLFTFADKGLTADPPTTLDNVEGMYGQLEGSLVSLHASPEDEEALTENSGLYRMKAALVSADVTLRSRSFTLYNEETQRRRGVQSHAPLVPYCGRAGYDQTRIIVAAGVGNYLVGEQVTNGSVSFTVSGWSSVTNTIRVYGVAGHTLPGAGNWVGSVSATTRAHSSYGTTRYLRPMDTTNTLTFTGGGAAPGWESSTDKGGWVAGNILYLYGLHTAGAITGHYEAARHAMGEWKITAVNALGTEITVENLSDSSRVFDNNSVGNTVEMGWFIGTREHVADRFTIYEAHPTAFSLHIVHYEVGGIVFDGKVGVWDPDYLMKDYTRGRLWSGYRCPYQWVRPARVRMSATHMEQNQQDGLYFMDLEVRSLGPSRAHNLEDDEAVRLVSTGCPIRGEWVGELDEYKGEGYVLSVRDPYMTYSRNEEVMFVTPPMLTPFGVEDTADKKVLMDSQSVSVNYAFAGIVGEIDAVIQSDSERVVSASLMARCFTPIYVRTRIQYAGTGEVVDIQTDVSNHVDSLTGSDRLEVSDIEGLMHRRGADFIDQDFALVGILHDQKRRILATRSRNYIGGDEQSIARRWATHRTSHFVVDEVDIERN